MSRLFDRVEIITYRDYVGVSSALLLFVAIVAPDVMCPDRRQHVLPLMFARPMTGVDYVMAKVGAIGAILFAFSFIPQVVLFVGNMLVSDSALDYLTDHLDILWKVPVAVFLLALYFAVVGVAIASLTDRRIVAGSAIIGLFLVTSIASGIIVGEDFEFEGGSPAALLNLFALAAVPARPRVPRRDRPRLPAQWRHQWRAAGRGDLRRRRDRRHRGAAPALPMGRAVSRRVRYLRRCERRGASRGAAANGLRGRGTQ